MKKGQKYDSFYDRILDYQKRKLQLLRKKRDERSEAKLTIKFNTLYQAKKRIRDPINEHFDSAIYFAKIIPAGYYPKKMREGFPMFKNFDWKKLSDYNFHHDPEEIKNQLIDEHNEFVGEIFNESRIKEMLNVIFAFNDPKNFTLSEVELEYMKNVAKIMATRSISELIKYIDPKYSKFLKQDLEKAIEICKMIN